MPIKAAYRADIDGLRGLAVLAVIVNHFNESLLHSGFFGVDIFFVISGFVVSASVASRLQKGESFRQFVSEFYWRRALRLLPALFFFCAVVAVALCLFSPVPGKGLVTGLASLFGLSNFYIYGQSMDYWSQQSGLNPFLHTWSLGVEFQFYLIFPVLAWFLFRPVSGSGSGALARRALLVIFGAFSFASLLGFVYLYPVNHSAAYYLTPMRLWQLSAGLGAYLLFAKWGHWLPRMPWLSWLLPIVFAALMACCFLPRSQAVFGSLMVVGLMVVLLIGGHRSSLLRHLLSLEALVYVGVISYSLYLWHWGILALGRWALPPEPWAVVLQLALIIAASLISFYWVEKPLRGLLSRKDISVGVSRLCVGMGLVGMVGLFLALGRLVKADLFAFGSRISPWAFPGANVIKAFDVKPQAVDCFVSQPVFDSQCVLLPRGEQDSARSIYLLGDSHANNHLGSLVEASLRLNQKSGGLKIAQVANESWIACNAKTSMHPGESCDNLLVRQRLTKNKLREQLQSGDLLIFSYARDRVMLGSDAGLPRRPDWQQLDVLKQSLVALAQLAETKGALLVLVEDIPKICADDQALLFGVIKRGQAAACQEEAEVSMLDRQPLSDMYRSIAERYANVKIVDFHDRLCPGEMCSALIETDEGRQLLFGDLSPHFTNQSQAFLVSDWLEAIHAMTSGLRS